MPTIGGAGSASPSGPSTQKLFTEPGVRQQVRTAILDLDVNFHGDPTSTTLLCYLPKGLLLGSPSAELLDMYLTPKILSDIPPPPAFRPVAVLRAHLLHQTP